MITHLWACDRMKTVAADTAETAARIYAGRIARRRWGDKGWCLSLRPDPADPLHFVAVIANNTRWAGTTTKEVILELELLS